MDGPDGGPARRAAAVVRTSIVRPRRGTDGKGTIIHGAPTSQGTTYHYHGAAGTGRADLGGAVAIVAGEAIEPLLGRLLSQAYLFDDPAAYEAGVRDAYELLIRTAAHEAAA